MPKQYLCGQFDVCLYYTRNTQEGNFGKFPRLYPTDKSSGFYAHYDKQDDLPMGVATASRTRLPEIRQ